MSVPWFKLSCNFYANPKIMAAGRSGRDVFLFALAKNSELGSKGLIPEAHLAPEYISNMLQISIEEAKDGMQRCNAQSLLTKIDANWRIDGWNVDEWRGPMNSTERSRKRRERLKNGTKGTDATLQPSRATNATYKIREDKIRSNTIDASIASFDFEKIYKHYPRKQGKKAGMAKAKKLIKTQADFDKFSAAVKQVGQNFQGRSTEYCPHFSTFVNQELWKDEELPAPSIQPTSGINTEATKQHPHGTRNGVPLNEYGQLVF